MTTSRELDRLHHQLADRFDEHPPKEWSPALVSALIALFDLHFAEGGSNKAPVLELVKR
jgi:hypothetical protein